MEDVNEAAVRRWKLKDAEGKEHSYRCTLVPVEEGETLMWELDALVVAPIGQLAGGALNSLDEVLDAGSLGELLDDPQGLKKAASVLKTIDFARVAETVAASISKANMQDLRQRLMFLVYRDEEPLRDASVFSRAYIGNWWELRRAMAHVIVVNRFFPLPATFGAAQTEATSSTPSTAASLGAPVAAG